MTERVAVVGGGMLGAATAEHLARTGAQVTLYEAAPHLGGLADAWQVGDVTWDRHYHVILLSDLRVRALLERIGLTDQVNWTQVRTGYYADGRLSSVSNAVEYLRLPGLGPIAKARLGATILGGSRISDGRAMERITVEAWLRKWSGGPTFERFWLPLLRAKLGDAYRETSAAFIWSTIQRLYAARSAGVGQEQFGYVRGGYATITARLADHLVANDVDLRLSSPVSAVRRAEGGLEVHCAGTAERFDRVIVTTAAPLAADLCPDLRDDERARLRAVRYQGIVCASVVLKRSLSPYYLTYITDPATPFTAVVEMTTLIDRSEVGGHHLVYLPKYAPAGDELFSLDDDAVKARFWPYLRSMYPTLGDDDVVAWKVSRVPQVFAVPTLNYSDAMPPMTTSVPGLVLCGSAHLVHATLNVNDTISLVEQLPAAGRSPVVAP